MFTLRYMGDGPRFSIEKEDHDYQVVAVDSLDWLVRRIEESVSGCAAGKTDSTLNRSHGGYGNGKQVLKNHIYQVLLPCLDRIVGRGIAVVLLAHAKRTEITDIDGITVEKVSPKAQGLVVVLATDAEKVKPGLRGNLIFEVFREHTPAPTEANPSPKPQRTSQGILPAVPFEVIGRAPRK